MMSVTFEISHFIPEVFVFCVCLLVSMSHQVEHPFDISYSLQVKAFSRSLESLKTAIVVGGTNIAEQVTNFGKIMLLSTLQIPRFSEGLEIVFFRVLLL